MTDAASLLHFMLRNDYPSAIESAQNIANSLSTVSRNGSGFRCRGKVVICLRWTNGVSGWKGHDAGICKVDLHV